MENLCIFIGNMGAKADVRTLENGTKLAQFSIACNEKGYTKKDGTQVPERTEWIPIVVYRPGLADIIEKYTQKGSRIYVKGKFRTRTYEDKDGNRQWRTEIYADEIKLLDSRRNDVPLPPDVWQGSQVPTGTGTADTQVPGNATPFYPPYPGEEPFAGGDRGDVPF